MITIKEFAELCCCSTQTLRYYDRIGLLKPVKVADTSGYRYYAETQALDFVKIKNLQLADFSIEEIKRLLVGSDREITEAFDKKIAEHEERLERIIHIREAYLRDKPSMETKLSEKMTELVMAQLTDVTLCEEFGLAANEMDSVKADIRSFIRLSVQESLKKQGEVTMHVDGEVIRGADKVVDKLDSFELNGFGKRIELSLNDEEDDFGIDEVDYSDYETLFERHGFKHVYEFIDAVPPLEPMQSYLLSFRLNKAWQSRLKDDASFALLMLGAIILRNKEACSPGAHCLLACDCENSDDEQNHFYLLRK